MPFSRRTRNCSADRYGVSFVCLHKYEKAPRAEGKAGGRGVGKWKHEEENDGIKTKDIPLERTARHSSSLFCTG